MGLRLRLEDNQVPYFAPPPSRSQTKRFASQYVLQFRAVIVAVNPKARQLAHARSLLSAAVAQASLVDVVGGGCGDDFSFGRGAI